MVVKTASKLNHLQHILPEGLLVDSAWLEREGYSRQLRAKYVGSDWLETPARGVYRRPVALVNGVIPNAGLEWERAICSLQILLKHPAYVGGRTSLELQGFGHYISVWKTNEVQLYTPEPLPKWFGQLDLRVHVSVHRRSLFAGDVNSLAHEAQPAETTDLAKLHVPSLAGGALADAHRDGRTRHPRNDRPAADEGELRAGRCLHARSLPPLSPRRLQTLLEACQSVKVKRLFLFLAERHNHAWLKKLDLARDRPWRRQACLGQGWPI